MTWPAKFGEWTTPAEGMPSVAETVILYLSHGVRVSGFHQPSHGFPFQSTGDGYPLKLSEVIAWMPMPDGPSGESGHDPAPSSPEHDA